MQIRRMASGLFILAYVMCLAWGVGAHALKVGLAGNTTSYFCVWDMFCGWQAYDNRTRIIGEDSNGNYYAVEEPWGAFTPFGNVARVNYDVSNNLISRHIKNVLDHSQHPGIDRVYVVQEIWPKQFNVPDRLWAHYFHEPKDKTSYYNLRAICDASGMPVESYPDWFNAQTLSGIADNPRLQRAAERATPYYNTFFNPSELKAQRSTFRSSADGLNTN
jgi:hypothetical protein